MIKKIEKKTIINRLTLFAKNFMNLLIYHI